MRRKILWALAGANIVLGTMCLMHLFRAEPAVAQARRPSEYVMIPADIPGGRTGIVYVVDMTNGALSAMAYDDAKRELNFMRPMNLDAAFAAGQRR
jgi:hypothetical protein